MSSLRDSYNPSESDLENEATLLRGSFPDADVSPLAQFPAEIDQLEADRELHPVLQVARAGSRDLLRLRKFSGTFLLHQPDLEVCGYQVPGLWGAIARRLRADDGALVIVKAGNRPIVFADFRPEMPDFRWNAIAVGIEPNVLDPAETLLRAIEVSVREAGNHGVKRLYTRVPTDSPIANAFMRAGFHPYAQETVYVSERPSQLSRGIPLRAQDRSDTWSIHQLYNRSVPQAVLQAEAYTSHRWDLPEGRTATGAVVHGSLLEMDHQVDIYMRTMSSADRHLIDLLYRPESFNLVGEVLDWTLQTLQRQRSAKRVFVPVRSYAQEVEHELLARGFRPWNHQTLMLKYTTVPVRAASVEAFAFEQIEAVERLPKRIPAFLALLRRKTSTRESD